MATAPASSSSPHDHGITVGANPLSASLDYVRVKQMAAKGDDVSRVSQEMAENWFGAMSGIARVTDSQVATVAVFNPLLRGVPKWADLMASAQEAWRSAIRIWSTAHQKISEPEWMRSPEHARNMINYGKWSFGPLFSRDDDEVNRKLNGHFFSHNSDGSLNKAQPEEIQQIFDPARRDAWPNLILTSSHALVRDHTDISGTMKGFHALIMHSFGDAKGRAVNLPLIRRTDQPEQVDAPAHKATIMLSAVHNDRNAWINGGNLLLRLHHLDQLYESQKRGEAMTQTQLEDAYLQDISPAALQLSKLILSLIVTDPQRVRTDPKAPEIISPKRPLVLREDAAEVLQHIKLAGYSKGGNIVTDAARHLILQLQHVGAVLAPRSLDPQVQVAQNQSLIPVSDTIVASLMHNLGILAVNPGICPLTDREKDLGMRRISVRNDLDRISAHLFRKHEREDRFGTHDDVYRVNGKSMGDLGHGMEGSLGTREAPGYLIDEDKVAPSDIPTLRLVRSRLQAFFASCYGHVGISHVHDDPAKPGELGIEFSTGVSQAQVQSASDAIVKAMEQAGLRNVSMACGYDAQRRCHVNFDPPADAGQRQKILTEGLHLLHQNSPDIFVSGTVFRELGLDPEAPRRKSPSTHVAVPAAARDRLDLGNTPRKSA